MKETELRIGNYFNLYGQIATLVASDFSKWEGKFDNFKPIPLTEQWLKDFGFRISFSWNCYIKGGLGFPLNNTTQCRILVVNDSKPIIIECKYVHKLQNLYFTITGKELTK